MNALIERAKTTPRRVWLWGAAWVLLGFVGIASSGGDPVMGAILGGCAWVSGWIWGES